MNLNSAIADLIAEHASMLEVEVGKGTVRVDSVRNLVVAFDTSRGEYQRYARAVWSPWTLEGREPIQKHFVAKKLAVSLFHLLTLICFAPHLKRAEMLDHTIGSFEADRNVMGASPLLAVAELCVKGSSLGLEGFLFHASRNLMMYEMSLSDLLDAYGAVMAEVKRGNLDSILGD